MGIAVRPARAGEGPRLADIYLAAARAAWADHLPAAGLAELVSPAGDWEEAIADPEVILLVAEVDGEVVALAHLIPSTDPDADPARVAKLRRLYAQPAAWGKGLGAALLAESMDELARRGFREATLWTAEWNRFRAFYEARGWSLDGATRETRFAGATFTEVRHRIAVPSAGGQSVAAPAGGG